MKRAAAALTALERLKTRFETAITPVKLRHLRALARLRLRSADQVRRLHELLCFMRAYPDSAALLKQVEAMLARFARRSDLRVHRDELAYTGIAGTTLWFPFFYPTACRLAQRWPALLTLDRTDTVAGRSIAGMLPALLTPVEMQGLREAKLGGFEALDRVRGRITDATFLIARVTAMPGDDWIREAVYDAINPSCELAPGPDTPTRTHAVHRGAPRSWQTADLRRARPDLRRELVSPPRSMRRVARAEATALIELARDAMATRERDLDAFAYAHERDVWLVDDGGGLAYVLIGIRPERRAVVSAIYGGLTLQNGVPVGYHQSDLTGRNAAISFNAFDTFRGTETGHTFARLLAALHHGFGSTSFSIEPYQLGKDNEEGLESGAWWFYAKLGFRPRTPVGRALAQQELSLAARRPQHRSPSSVLRRLAEHYVYFDLDAHLRAPPIAPATLALATARWLSTVAGADRSAGEARASAIVMQRCGLRSLRTFDAAERRAWVAYAPLLAQLPLQRWSAGERRALVEVIRAKGAASERDYVRRAAELAVLTRSLSALGDRS
jgi:hypothetical protein